MRVITELVLVCYLLAGVGEYAADFLLNEVKKAAAHKIVKHSKRSLGDYTRQMTKGY